MQQSHSCLPDGITFPIGARVPAIGARPVSAPVVLGSQHVARHAESSVSSGSQIPANPFLKFTGRGADRTLPPRPLPQTVHESARVSEVTCPHGCQLKFKVIERKPQRVVLGLSYLGNRPQTVDLLGTLPVDRMCPGCSKHLRVQLVDKRDAFDDDASEVEIPERKHRGYAYMACLWAPSETKSGRQENLKKYIHDALILGHCLWKNCQQRRVLLVTSDTFTVSQDQVRILEIFWELRKVEHMKVHRSRLQGSDRRFADVFTKVRALEQTEFSKVILMDLDTIVVQSIDELFGYAAPSALFRGNGDAAAGIKRAGNTLFNKSTGAAQGGINSGVLVLEPSRKDFEELRIRINEPGPATSAPEQDFLSTCGLYIDRWLKLPVKYNWQPHQLRYMAGRMAENQGERRMPIEQVSVLHFSGEVCPRDYFHGGFYTLWTGDTGNGFGEFTQKLVDEYSKGKCGVDDRERMKCAILKWKDAHDEAWYATINAAAGRFTRCPLCDDRDNFVEHAFFMCQSTQGGFKKWRERSTTRDLEEVCGKFCILIPSSSHRV